MKCFYSLRVGGRNITRSQSIHVLTRNMLAGGESRVKERWANQRAAFPFTVLAQAGVCVGRPGLRGSGINDAGHLRRRTSRGINKSVWGKSFNWMQILRQNLVLLFILLIGCFYVIICSALLVSVCFCHKDFFFEKQKCFVLSAFIKKHFMETLSHSDQYCFLTFTDLTNHYSKQIWFASLVKKKNTILSLKK